MFVRGGHVKESTDLRPRLQTKCSDARESIGTQGLSFNALTSLATSLGGIEEKTCLRVYG